MQYTYLIMITGNYNGVMIFIYSTYSLLLLKIISIIKKKLQVPLFGSLDC